MHRWDSSSWDPHYAVYSEWKDWIINTDMQILWDPASGRLMDFTHYTLWEPEIDDVTYLLNGARKRKDGYYFDITSGTLYGIETCREIIKYDRKHPKFPPHMVTPIIFDVSE